MTRLNTLRKLILPTIAALVAPGAAWAEVCDKVRPLWDPASGPATLVDEALHLASLPPSLILMVGTALAVRLRSQWGGLAVVSGWSILISVLVFGNRGDATGIHQHALSEGCIASPALFIGVVTAICIATVIYTAPAKGRGNT
ncbi:MAG: hypothetical protein N4A61_07345 [Pelagimonas sp.]|jgi:hypothetical protein|nr:hypothetical protein [Pelagimonas sp.]